MTKELSIEELKPGYWYAHFSFGSVYKSHYVLFKFEYLIGRVIYSDRYINLKEEFVKRTDLTKFDWYAAPSRSVSLYTPTEEQIKLINKYDKYVDPNFITNYLDLIV
jgi:hypothetical protein